MKRQSAGSWMASVLVVAAMAAAVWSGRHRFDVWTRERLATQHARQWSKLDEPQAADMIAQLHSDDRGSLGLVVAALADSRPSVAAAAESALLARLERWRRLRSAESSPRVAALADVLAERAASLPKGRREFIQQLAQRLIAWPIDREVVEPGRVIAGCETVLRLEPWIETDIRVAALELPEADDGQVARNGDAGAAEPPAVAEPLPPLVPAPRESSDARLPIVPREPDRLPEAGQETPVQPRRFLPPRGIGSVSDG